LIEKSSYSVKEFMTKDSLVSCEWIRTN
jgi:hypothetical protein